MNQLKQVSRIYTCRFEPFGYPVFFTMAQQPLGGQVFLIIEES